MSRCDSPGCVEQAAVVVRERGFCRRHVGAPLSSVAGRLVKVSRAGEPALDAEGRLVFFVPAAFEPVAGAMPFVLPGALEAERLLAALDDLENL